MAEPTFYLFDGYNLLHAGSLDDRQALVDRLASWLAARGVRGVVVFDGVGEEGTVGPLAVRFDRPADRLIERLAAEHRDRETVCVVSSDTAIRETAGVKVRKRSSKGFLHELERDRSGAREGPPARFQVADRLDEATRARLERWRRSR
jgi:predicted RNA-binding protein with PIN domain